MASLLDRLIAGVLLDSSAAEATVADVRVGTHWTAVVAQTRTGLRAGLASTQVEHHREHGIPSVRNAGSLLARPLFELVDLARSQAPTERSIGFAALNAMLRVDESLCTPLNAEDLIVEWGSGRRVAFVGHFPFVPRVSAIAAECWVLELDPGPTDLPAEAAPRVIPEADVVAITGMSMVNSTFGALAALCRADARVLVLGPSTPLSPIVFDYGVDAVSGTVIDDIPAALAAVSQGGNFRQVAGKRLLTMRRP